MTNHNAEIIAVGTELLLGQIVNTNAQWLSQRMAEKGLNVYHHTVVGDNLERVKKTFEIAQQRSDLVFVTGGLGPTEDDLTREAFQAMTNRELIEDTLSIQKITSYFIKTNRHMTPNNRKQALVFKHATVLSNDVGMAPGMIVEHESVIWVFMQGVPREMKSITENHVLPFLTNKINLSTIIQSRMLRFIGIGESQLEHQLKPLIDVQQNPTIAPLASEGEVAIRISAKEETKEKANQLIDQTERKVLAEVGTYFYGYDDETIQSKVIQLLSERSYTFAAAESLTGGKFTDSIISISGASKVCKGAIVSYSTDVKVGILGVPHTIIESYGTVSEQCAKEMAENVKDKMNADIGISFTGVAGPEPIEGRQVGTVFISLMGPFEKKVTREFHFLGDREAIRNRTVKKGLELMYRLLKEDLEKTK